MILTFMKWCPGWVGNDFGPVLVRVFLLGYHIFFFSEDDFGDKLKLNGNHTSNPQTELV